MKNILSLICIVILWTACQQKTEIEKPITKRAYHINSENAYNNLFFDSMALEKYLIDHQPDDSIIRRMRSFYNARNFQYAWFSPTGLTEQARGFWNLHSYHSTYTTDSLLQDKELDKTMENILADQTFTVNAGNKSYLDTEMKLTHHFILYTLTQVEDGYQMREEMEHFIPIQKQDALALADSMLNSSKWNKKEYSDVNKPYADLKAALKKYVDIAKTGNLPPVTLDADSVSKKSSGKAVAALKKRLQVSGELTTTDTSTAYTPELESAIWNFQERNGFTPTGELTKEQLEELNVPVKKRIEQILINLSRMQWAIHQPEGKLISVNIPEFLLRVRDSDKMVHQMAVVVGKSRNNTTLFTGNLNQIVFSPYWNVPISITRNEILPAMNRNSDYLARNNMEMNGEWGNGLPKIRQKPGPKNSLGKVKFLFPNSFDIYFHDTPAKSLFEEDMRAFSHGCIRLSEPEWLANYLLKDNPDWSPEKIKAAMNSGTEKYVKLDNPVPVIISYYTAWVDGNNRLHFARDIYGHDKKQAEKMFLP